MRHKERSSMVICFEEKNRTIIESTGMTIIEFKQIIYNTRKCTVHIWEILAECRCKIVSAWNIFTEKFAEAVDNIRLVIEKIMDQYHYPTSSRYKIVKVFSKCTGTNICFWWKNTYKMKRWLARSCI